MVYNTGFRKKIAAVARIPAIDVFNEEKIQAFVIGKQNMRSGSRQMACGDVTAVRFADGKFVGSVHAEKTGNQNYETRVTFGGGGEIASSECACAARRNAHNKCKHVSAGGEELSEKRGQTEVGVIAQV
jgi:uncharacterized Zn finger protein